MSDSLVSVCLITYNHAKYIREAIDGVLMQKVNFTWELIIADDFSTDGTREIVLEYARNYPAFIKLILQERNVGAAQNWMDLMAAPSGKYIAYFEGDDYWTNPYKLQKQVDFLNSHPTCSFSFHNANVTYADGSVKDYNYFDSGQKKFIGIEDLFYMNVPTASVMYRRGLFDLPEWITVSTADWLINILNAKHGKGGYIDEIMSVYRILPTGASRDRIKMNKAKIIMFEHLNKYFDCKYDKDIKERISHHCSVLATEYCKKGFRDMESGDYDGALLMFEKALETSVETSDVHYGCALAYSHLGCIEDAVREAEAELSLNRKHKAAMRLIQTFRKGLKKELHLLIIERIKGLLGLIKKDRKQSENIYKNLKM